jgi:hypothetical protein
MRPAPALLFLGGLLLVALPLVAFFRSPSVAEQRRERAAMAGWPSVEGRLAEVRFQKAWHLSRGRTWYALEPVYRYAVDGREHEGDRWGARPVRATSEEELQAIVRALVGPAGPASVRREPKPYAEPGADQGEARTVWSFTNQAVRVRYDPGHHASSVLDPRDDDPPSLGKELAASLGCTILGAVLVAASALYRRRP